MVGSALGFVLVTILLRQISALAVSYVHLLVPFGALVLGATFYGEHLGVRALAGAALVSTGLLVAQAPRRCPAGANG